MDDKVILSLAEQVQKLGAGEGHVTFNNIKETEGLTAVISVYDNQKPAHLIVEELYEWAEENNPEVKEMIEKLDADMSWNKDSNNG